MPDYKELYFKLYARVAEITEELIAIQNELEELYIRESEEEKIVLFKSAE